MAAINRKSEIETQTDVISQNKSGTILKRLFSNESTASSIRYTYELYPASNYQYSLCGKEFLLKLLQLLIAVISAGLYSSGLNVMAYSVTSLMFPNIVFSSFIIITSVIAISYVLGQVMPEILIRVFNGIGMVLYFVSACITGHAWYGIGRHSEEEEEIFYAKMLLAQVVTSSVNAVLYGVDLGISVRKALKGLQ